MGTGEKSDDSDCPNGVNCGVLLNIDAVGDSK